jgi:cyclomaltodextrinase
VNLTDTPDWVRDAVFYQVFPDRFARSGRVRAPGPLEAWDEPPTPTGFKGGDLYGVADHLDHIAYILAEIWFPRPEVLGGDQYDAIMNYGFLTAVASYAGGAHVDRRIASEHGWLASSVFPEDGPAFAGRLDRLMTQFRPEVTAVQYNLVGSHDTPRILSVCGGDTASIRLATLVQVTVPGAPAIYYGDEIGMTGSIDPFARAAFPWSRPDTWDDGLRTYITAAIRLRHDRAVLRRGAFRIAGAAGSVITWLRTSRDGDAALIALNNGEAPQAIAVDVPEVAGRVLQPAALPGDEPCEPLDVGAGSIVITIPARSGRVFIT